MKTTVRFTALTTLLTALFLLTAAIPAEKPALSAAAAEWTEWRPLHDGNDNLVDYRYSRTNERTMVLEFKNNYPMTVAIAVEVNTNWAWLPESNDIDYIIQGIVLDPGATLTQPIRGSKFLGIKIKRFSQRETAL
jgi:hypothetical protein